MIRRFLRGSEWRREVLRTNLWLVPAVEVIIAVLLFVIRFRIVPHRTAPQCSRMTSIGLSAPKLPRGMADSDSRHGPSTA